MTTSANYVSSTGTRKFMSALSPPRSDADSILREGLEFPEGSGVEPQTHSLPADEVIRLSEERLPFITSRPGFEEERLRSKCQVPFELLD
jgi:hypothetical protein